MAKKKKRVIPHKKFSKKKKSVKGMPHTVSIAGWAWLAFIEEDPRGLDNPAPYIREILYEHLSKRRRKTDEDVNDQLFVNSLSEEAEHVRDLLEDDGVFLTSAPTARTGIGKKHGPCIIDALVLADEEDFDPPDMMGEVIVFADFIRPKQGLRFKAPVDPKWKDILVEIYLWQKEQAE